MLSHAAENAHARSTTLIICVGVAAVCSRRRVLVRGKFRKCGAWRTIQTGLQTAG